MRSDLFTRLPTPTALLLLSGLLELTEAHALPQQTKTVEYHTLNVVPWPLATAPPSSPGQAEDLRRRQDWNTVCGYIGGDPNLAATCGAGSHCVLDADHSAVGCCPNGGACTTGVFTGCVDYNSGALTEANPYVYTCQGSDECYKNDFGGGYFQYGCGTASNLATKVHASASGLSANLRLSSLTLSFTEQASSLATPTSINPSTGTRSFTRDTSSDRSSHSMSGSHTSRPHPHTSHTTSHSTSKTTSKSSSSKSSSSTTSHTSTTVTPTSSQSTTLAATPAPSSDSGGGSGVDRNGAIIGGTVSGAAVLIALAAVGFYMWRRKRGNLRSGPGAGGTEYISPMSGGGANFQALHTSNEGYESGLGPEYAHNVGQGTTTEITGGGPNQGYSYPYSYRGADMGAPVGAAAGGAAAYGAYRGAESDQVPLTHEIDDFSHGFQRALSRIGEEEPNTGDLGEYSGSSSGNLNGNMNGNGGAGIAPSPPESTHGGDGGGRPLWQQNRRQSRNLMWM